MKAIWMAAALMLSFSTVACGGGEGACKSICKKSADCELPEGVEYDQGACETACEDFAADADEAGCKKEFNKAVKCAKKNFDCEASDSNPCESEAEAYGECAAADAE